MNNKQYKTLYHTVDAFIKKVNPCKIECGKCQRGKDGGKNFCCSGCRYLTEHGCGADRPIACRAFLCETAKNNLTDEQKKLYVSIRGKCGRLVSDPYLRKQRYEIINKKR